MNSYEKPEFDFVHSSTDELSENEYAKMSDDELVDHLKKRDLPNSQKKYRIKSGYVLREIAGEYALIPVDTDGPFTNAIMAPNDSAVFLWKAFQQPTTIEKVVRKGIQEYDTTEETIRNATHRFVEDTLKYHILEEVE